MLLMSMRSTSIEDVLSTGVMDFCVPARTSGWLNAEPQDGAATTGIFSAVGPFPVGLLADAFIAMTAQKTLAGERAVINPRFVLAQPWRAERLMDCRHLLELGSPPPTVFVDRVRYTRGRIFYRVVDGHHRVAAARLSGSEMIQAEILSDVEIDASRYFVAGAYLFRNDTSLQPVDPSNPLGKDSLELRPLSAQLRLTLQALGCPTINA